MSNTSRTSWLLSQEMPFEAPFSSCELMLAGCSMMMLGMLQPAKGAVISAQWWFGLHGFLKERLPEDTPSDPA